jgi:two-component system OmpR family response regulator
MKILIIEDTQDLATSLVRFLATKNISSQMSLDGEDGLYRASTSYYDAIVLDINLPGKNGIQVCQQLREKEKNVPIIMLTSRSSKNDVIIGLEAGADDYLIKPFDYDILVARLEALTRRNLKNKSTSILKIWGYSIDLEKIEVTHWEEIIHLSRLEFDLCKYFAQNKWNVISRQELYEKVWGEFEWDFMFSKTVDVYIWYLRKKLGRDIVETRKGYGYIAN